MDNRWNKWIFLTILNGGVFLFLSIELISLLFGNGSICSTSSCRVAAETVRFGNHALVGVGAGYFFILTILSVKLNADKSYRRIFLIELLILSGLAFDGAIIGFQYFNLASRCLICLTVAGLLLILMAVYASFKKSFYFFSAGLLVWISAVMANAILIGHQDTPTIKEISLWEYNKNDSEFPRNVLLFSMRCPHCIEVLKVLESNPPTENWTLASIDRDPASLRLLSSLSNTAPDWKPSFAALINAKELHLQVQEKIFPEVDQYTKKTHLFYKNNGFKHVPQLLVQKNENQRIVLSGEEAIRDYISNKHDDIINN
jgi:hypothetical protein